MAYVIDRRFVLFALPALGACAAMPPADGPGAEGDPYSGKSVVDAAIAAAGGEEALRKVKELYWTGSATVTASGKTTELEMETKVRPFTYARSTSWPKGQERKGAAKSIQVEFGEAWSVNRVSWTPLPKPQAEHEAQQFAMYGLMMLVPLKDAGVTVRESAPGKDGTRNLHVEHPQAPAADLRFGADGRLILARNNVRDPSGGASLIPQEFTFTDTVESNGVKWPRRIQIMQNGTPYFDLQIATFEARAAVTNTPLQETL